MTGQRKTEGFRLNRYLARSGVASRRKCDLLIMDGLVAVNGVTVKEPGHRICEGDTVTCLGRQVRPLPEVTAMLNKPLGYETSLAEGRGMPFSELMDGLPAGTVPVGRLDINTGGLILLSNDGELVHRLTHPSREVEREYRVFTAGTPGVSEVRRIAGGASLGREGFSKPLSVRRTGRKCLNLVLVTGRNREVRRLFRACGVPIDRLERVRYGPVRLGDLERGKWRFLTSNELQALRGSAGLT